MDGFVRLSVHEELDGIRYQQCGLVKFSEGYSQLVNKGHILLVGLRLLLRREVTPQSEGGKQMAITLGSQNKRQFQQNF